MMNNLDYGSHSTDVEEILTIFLSLILDEYVNWDYNLLITCKNFLYFLDDNKKFQSFYAKFN